MGPWGPYGMGNMNEGFSARTFYGGSLTGYRSWLVTLDGVLKPVVQANPYEWKMGINEAHCYRAIVTGEVTPVLVDVPIYDKAGNVVETVRRHQMVSKACSCGFWAYFPGGGSHHGQVMISGLVRGTGKVVRGPKGFRCEKAEILALIEPRPPTTISDDLLRRILSNYEGIPMFSTLSEATQTFPISTFPNFKAISK